MSREWGMRTALTPATKHSQAPLLAPLNEGLPEAMSKICLEFISSLSFFYDAEAGDKKINDYIAWHVNASPLRDTFVGSK